MKFKSERLIIKRSSCFWIIFKYVKDVKFNMVVISYGGYLNVK